MLVNIPYMDGMGYGDFRLFQVRQNNASLNERIKN